VSNLKLTTTVFRWTHWAPVAAPGEDEHRGHEPRGECGLDALPRGVRERERRSWRSRAAPALALPRAPGIREPPDLPSPRSGQQCCNNVCGGVPWPRPYMTNRRRLTSSTVQPEDLAQAEHLARPPHHEIKGRRLLINKSSIFWLL
jgi:hypothetical protein